MKKGKSRRGTGRTALQKAEWRAVHARIEELTLQGFRAGQIAATVGKSPATVCQHQKLMRKRWDEWGPRETAERMAEHLAKLDMIYNWASVGYQQSQVERERCSDCRGNPGMAGGKPDAEEWCEMCRGTGWVSERRAGDSAMLRVMNDVMKEKARVQGFAPNRPDGSTTNVQNIIGRVEASVNRFADAPPELLLEVMEAVARAKEASAGMIGAEPERKGD